MQDNYDQDDEFVTSAVNTFLFPPSTQIEPVMPDEIINFIQNTSSKKAPFSVRFSTIPRKNFPSGGSPPLEQKCVNCSQSHPSDSKLCQKGRKLESRFKKLKPIKTYLYFEAHRLIVPQLTQTYAQAARPSTISTASQTGLNLSNIICPPLQCLTPISSKNPLPGASSSVSTFSTSSSSTQDNLLPSPSGILPTIQSESLLQIPIPTTTSTTSPGNNLNTLVSPLETETRSRTTPTGTFCWVKMPQNVPRAKSRIQSIIF
ncbi:uncharacterized protein TNCV_1921651 [Trichonephila clavipes]|nr:uncharacterized protein TNCV_1921651 [Trichonephila clavipes]